MAVLSLAEAKEHLRVDDDDQDALIAGLISAAEDHVERVTGLVLERRTVTEAITGFGGKIRAWPVVSIESVDFIDAAGVDQQLAANVFRANVAVRPARLMTVGSAWPVLGRLNGTVNLTMTAGFADASSVPPGVVQAIRMIVGHFFRNRDAVVTMGTPVEVPMAADMLLEPYRPRAI